MAKLIEEITAVHKANFHLKFIVPTEEELKKIRMIYRDRTSAEKARIKKVEQNLKELLYMIRRGELALENLPPDIKTGLANLLRNEKKMGDDT